MAWIRVVSLKCGRAASLVGWLKPLVQGESCRFAESCPRSLCALKTPPSMLPGLRVILPLVLQAVNLWSGRRLKTYPPPKCFELLLSFIRENKGTNDAARREVLQIRVYQSDESRIAEETTFRETFSCFLGEAPSFFAFPLFVAASERTSLKCRKKSPRKKRHGVTAEGLCFLGHDIPLKGMCFALGLPPATLQTWRVSGSVRDWSWR